MKKGFTLAEVLITLAVIGVVASLAIPLLLKNTSDAEYKIAFKKIFSEINNAHNQLLVNGKVPYVHVDNFIADYVLYFNSTKICNNSQSEGCWHTSSNWYDYANFPITQAHNAKGLILPDGSIITFRNNVVNSPGNYGAVGTTNNSAMFGLVDVNGFKKPNKVGVDIFGFHLYATRALPSGAVGTHYTNDSIYCNKNAASASYYNGLSCSDSALVGEDY